MKTFAAIWIAISLFPAWGMAAQCTDVAFEATEFTVCEADPAREDIRLFLDASDGSKLGTFENLSDNIASGSVVWAMNAGMYHQDRSPVGLYIEGGEQIAPIVTREGPGNFGLLPNGVLCLESNKAAVIESRAFAKAPRDCVFATQSGPMLVIDGQLHPRFIPDSDSLNIRNGVGVAPDGRLIAAISKSRVNFHQFARLFRDVLKTPNALFLDGSVSTIRTPKYRISGWRQVGPMIGVYDKR